MADITVIGLGRMGAALARAMGQAGHDLTVWNRSPDKMTPFIDDGVAAAPNVVAAISASPVILICVDSNSVADGFMRTDEVKPHLAGRTIVQLSTSTPREATDSDAWMSAEGAAYLDGAIHCGPHVIGTDRAEILLSGDKAAYDRAAGLLAGLGGDIRYLGANVRAASVLDLAAVCESFGRFMAVSHAARMCESEGIGLDELAVMYPEDSFSRRYANVIHASEFDKYTASLRIWESAVQRIRTQGRDAGINTDFPDYVARLFEKAIDAGYGEQHVMALVKILRDSQ
ncbi:MAG: NAD(P)-binding domain-containing protein [Alphaproteobacteria bacterium]